MSKPESELPAPGSEPPARTGTDPGTDPGANPGVDTDKAGAAPATGQDPRVDFRKEVDAPAAAPAAHDPVPAAPAAPAEPVSTDPAPVPDAAQPSVPAAPADPWAAPDFTAAPPPTAAVPSAAPPPPPHPLPAGGWASVTPSAQAGFQPNLQPALPPGFQAGHPYPLPVGPAPTNGFAVAALVTGLILMAPLALVFGIVALVQINRTRDRGFGMAVTGVVLGAIGTLLLPLLLVVGVFTAAHDGRFAQVPKAPAGSVRWSALKAGDCYSSPAGGSVTDGSGDETVYWVRRVACADAHHGEVAGTAKIPAGNGPYPGESEVRESAARLCRKVLDDYALDQWAVPDGMDDVYLYPTASNWAAGERYVTCAFEDREDAHRGTVHTDRNSLTAPQLVYLDAVRAFDDVYLDPPKKGASDAGADDRDWARRMAAASRAEAAALGAPTANWPADVQPKIAKLVEAQSQAAAAWDAAASGDDPAGGIRRARALVAKTAPVTVDVRRALGLSTGEQAPDLRV